MFTVSSLVLEDALLKCVVTDVVLFSIVAFKTLTFHKIVQQDTLGVAGFLVILLLEMFSWFWQWNKCEIGQYVTTLSHTKMCQFLGHPVYYRKKLLFLHKLVKINNPVLKACYDMYSHSVEFTLMWYSLM